MSPRYLIPLALGLLVGCSHAPEPKAEAPEEPPSGVVVLPREALALVKLQTAKVERQTFATSRDAMGQITSRPEGESVVHAPMSGHVLTVHAKVGDRVSAGAPLATLKSVTLGAAQASYLKAKGEADLARRERNRLRGLLEAELGAKKDLDEAEQREASAQVSLTQAREELRVLGMSDGEIAGLKRIDPKVVLRAPMGGTIVDRHVAVGQYVTPESAEPLFSLLDLSTVRVQADLPERDFVAVRVGLPASVQLAALPDRTFAGKVVRLSPTVDASSRTGEALIDLPNPTGTLKPGMAVKVSIALSRPGVSAVPASAVQREGDRAFVYVPLGAERFEEVAVKLGESNPQFIEVLEGPDAGTSVVTQGSFDLRSQARKAQFGGE